MTAPKISLSGGILESKELLAVGNFQQKLPFNE